MSPRRTATESTAEAEKPAEAVGSSGRAGSAEIHHKVLDATAELLAELGYLEFTVEKVALRAGVSRKAVYHRWSSKSELVGELLIRDAVVDDVPDVGSTRQELRVLFGQILRDVHDGRGSVLSALWANMGDPAVMERFRAEVLGPRRQFARAVVQRGIARGDFPPDVDVDLLLDSWSGVVMFRTEMRGDAFLASQVEALIEVALAGNVPRIAAPPAPAD
ncbi:TetR/AcrR family transcriptional regulator C-terminal ligand-binding domain-containing protein [Streptomyces sp. DW26H14]|uniref:TetR/AcrR family transcriptional regulator C-terminal ligand-binding domain-containing protein n=1 Tax=Streptomyces sp. DW26H14 TaxID=3435395 RepID=UPI00403DD6B9